MSFFGTYGDVASVEPAIPHGTILVFCAGEEMYLAVASGFSKYPFITLAPFVR